MNSRSKKRKKERGQYPAILTEQAWSIQDLFFGQNVTSKNNIVAFVGTKRAIPNVQDRLILPPRVANQNTGFPSSCLLAELAI